MRPDVLNIASSLYLLISRQEAGVDIMMSTTLEEWSSARQCPALACDQTSVGASEQALQRFYSFMFPQ
jgi:hypothetical protein